MAYSDSDASSSDDAEDPIERLMKLAEKEDLSLEQPKQQKQGLGTTVQSSGQPSITTVARKGGTRDTSTTVEANRGENVGDEDEEEEVVDKEIIAKIVARRLAAIDRGDDGNDLRHSSHGNDMRQSSHEDPLERIRRMQEAEEKRQELVKKREEARRQKQEAQQKGLSEPEGTDEDAAGKELVRRIIAMRLAAIDDEDNSSVHTSPEDPLVRIMNMDAEETLLSVIALTQYVEHQEENNEDDDEDDVLIRKRDFFDLNTMIQKNNLEELEKRAASLAESVKSKLSVSTLADLTQDNDITVDTSGVGFLALAMGGHKDVVNHSHVMNGLDISKITNDGDEDADRRFVSMSDSILESPSRKNKPSEKTMSELLGSISSQDSMRSLDEVITNMLNDICDLPGVEVTNIVPALNGKKGQGALETISPRLVPKNVVISKPGEKIPVNGVTDWWGVVGDFAGLRSGSSGEWSDSQSSMSYTTTESVTTASVVSLDASMQGLQVKFHDELPKYNGVAQPVVRKTIATEQLVSPRKSELSALEQKRRRKRELEAWKMSIERSFDKAG